MNRQHEEKNGDTIAIICPTFKKSKEALMKILEDMRYGDVEKVINNSGNFMVFLKNGNKYMALPGNDLIKGHRFDKVFVSKEMDYNFLKAYVFPYLRKYSLEESFSYLADEYLNLY